eukprot:4731016-Amphidinium_carterae.1
MPLCKYVDDIVLVSSGVLFPTKLWLCLSMPTCRSVKTTVVICSGATAKHRLLKVPASASDARHS